MICKNCGSEIPASAKFCDVCGTPVVREVGTRVKKEKVRVNWKLLLPFLGLIALLVVGPLMISRSVQQEYEQEHTMQTVSARVTPDQFNQIEKGMSYSQVKAIVGSEGVKTYHDGRIIEYTWPGEYHDKIEMDPKLRITFDKSTGQAETIEEVNILDGAEIYENERTNKEAVTKLTKKELGTIPGEASYETVCEMLGCEGVITYSMSSADGTYKVYEWRYLSKEDNEYRTVSLSFVDNRLYRY